MNTAKLIARDPALAAIVGATSADFGSDMFGFGGDEFSGDFGDEDDDSEDEMGLEYDYGDDVGFGAAKKPKKMNQAALAKRIAFSRTMARRSALNPNKYSTLKIEAYTFPLSQAITFGTGVAIDLSGQPDVTIRPQRLSCNSPAPMFAFFSEIKMANVGIMVGGGVEDAYAYNANGVGQRLDMPTLSPANRARITGTYSGFTPPGYTPASGTTFTASFKGPASLVAQ